MLHTQGEWRAAPKLAPIRRQATAWSIQNRRIPCVGVGQGVPVGRVRVREERRVEVDPDPPGPGPVDPAGEVLGPQRIPLDPPPAGLGIAGVEVEPVPAGDQAVCGVQVGPQLVRRPRLARIGPRHGQAAAERPAAPLEPADVVPLPAVDRDGDLAQPRHRPVDVDADGGVTLPGEPESALGHLVFAGHSDASWGRLDRVADGEAHCKGRAGREKAGSPDRHHLAGVEPVGRQARYETGVGDGGSIVHNGPIPSVDDDRTAARTHRGPAP